MVNVFSFCLFGLPRTDIEGFPLGPYYDGLLENIELIRKYYPTWTTYVYLGEDVSEDFAMYLINKYYSNIRIRRTGIVGHENTVHRFFAIDEPDVEAMFVRDADSRIHWKDRWAIQSFLGQGYGNVHIIRDHEQHRSSIAAGMWGMRKGALNESIRELYKNWTPVWAGHGDKDSLKGYGIDQNFLSRVIYTKIRREVFVNYSNGKLAKGEIGVEFPFQWSHDMYVGRPEFSPITDSFWKREKEAPLPMKKSQTFDALNILKRN